MDIRPPKKKVPRKPRKVDVRMPSDKATRASGPTVLGKRPHIVRHDAIPGRRGARRGFVRSLILFFVALVLVVILGLFVFDRAVVTVRPHRVEGDLDILLQSYENPSDNQLRYETMTLDRELSRTIDADGVEMVDARASGTIVVFNEESSEQRLREETRFESPEGLIFKTAKGSTTVVPAGSAENPGSVEVMVYAEQGGAEYNLELTDFVIPGWREIEDDRFDTQYARSKTAMTGGGSGKQPIISDELVESTVLEIKDILRDQMIAQAAVEVPEEFVFFEKGLRVSFRQPELMSVNEDQATVTVKGTATLYLFPEYDLATHVMTSVADMEEEEVAQKFVIENPSQLDMILSPQTEEVLEGEGEDGSESFRFRLRGPVKLVSDIDDVALLDLLQGVSSDEIMDIFESVPEVASANVSIRPFWKSRVPSRASKIRLSLE